jgi:hypothetical protein
VQILFPNLESLSGPDGMDVHDDFLEQLAEAESRDASRRSNASTASSKKSAASSKQSGSSSASAQAEMPSHRQGTPAKAAAKARGGATPNKGALKESNGKSTPASVAKAAKAAPASAAKPDAKQAGIAANKVEKEITEFGFKSLGPIAAGAFSTILKAKHVASGNEVAVKSFLRTTGEQQEEHEREMDILRKLSGTARSLRSSICAMGAASRPTWASSPKSSWRWSSRWPPSSPHRSPLRFNFCTA